MADTTPPVVDISEALTDEGRATWDAMAAIAQLIPIEQWIVVGGQMVALHAATWDRDAPRPTNDGDVIVDIRRYERAAMERFAAVLTQLGFTTYRSTDNVSTFARADGARIDLLAPEGVDDPVYTDRPARAVQAPGGNQALQRAETVTVRYGNGQVTIRRPTLIGATIAKAAAMREIPATAAERLRHEQDFLFLVELLASSDLSAAAAELSKSDRRRINAAGQSMLRDPTHQAWMSVRSESDVRTVLDVLSAANKT